ncbi:MAG TPA: thioredoxin domain-containing protein [Nannocystaceae bacterium]|nr:thioredoxin domain-containing protein [Nannocystaceae bacterium]
MTEVEAAFETRLLAERGGLIALARALVHGSDADAQDVVQDVLVTALSRSDRPRVLGPWLRQVLRNRIRGRARTARQRDAYAADLPAPAAVPDHEIALATAQLTDAVWSVLDDLEEPFRATVQRRFVDAVSSEDIARADGVAPATVRWRVHEGLQRMRDRLDDRFDGRAQWCGGLAPLFAIRVQEGATMSTLTILKLSLLLAGLGLASAAVVTTQSHEESAMADGGVETSAPTPVPAVVEREAAMSEAAPADAIESIDASALAEPELPPRKLLGRALKECIEGAPEGSLEGLEQIELDLIVFGAEQGSVFDKVNATTGRAIVEESEYGPSLGPADAPGVIQHEEIRQCILDTVEPNWLPTPAPFAGEYSGILGYIVSLDGHGRVPPPRPRVEEPGNELPDVSGQPVVDPQRAVETFGLAVEGPADAQVRIVGCGSYECRFCKKSQATLAALRERLPSLAIAWLQMPSGSAVLAAKAAIAAGKQDRFWEIHRALFELEGAKDRATIVAAAERLGLDRERFVADLDDPETARTVALQKEMCTRAGAWATPTFFVNGDMVRGELGVEEMSKTIAEIVAADE